MKRPVANAKPTARASARPARRGSSVRLASPAEMSWRAGIDAVSFGGTKNGLMGVEALVMFDPAKAWEFELRRKRGAHLFSKHRYLSAQMLADAGLAEDEAEDSDYFADLMNKLRAHLQDDIKEVRLSKRLTESAACLVQDCPDLPGGFYTPAPAMGERLLQRLIDRAGFTFGMEETA